MMTRNIGVGIGVATVLAMAASASAGPTWSSGRVAVSAAGINLATISGRQAFDRRVDAAISAMCGAPALGTRDEADALRACREEARTAAAPGVERLVARAGVTMASSRP